MNQAPVDNSAAQAAPPSKGGGFQTSYAILALGILLLANAASGLFYHPDRYSSPNRSWAYWAARDLNASRSTPDLVLFGSSLMLAVINDADATHFNNTLDAVAHHRSQYLESVLSKKLDRPVSTQSLAIGGQMASDAYALFSALIAPRKERPLLVWGIAPRDLVDSSFADPYNSETVRFLKKVTFPEPVLPERARFWTEVENGLERVFSLYGKRTDLQREHRVVAERLISQVIGTRFDTIRTAQPLLKLTLGAVPEECAPGQWLVAPYRDKLSKSEGFADNSKEYEMRYRPFRKKLFDRQCRYLDRFLSRAEELGFRTVLVNMPLCKDNLSILPDGVYALYLKKVSQSAAAHGAEFIDLNRSTLFARSDFCDPVHLHGVAGQKFLDILASQLTDSTLVARRSNTVVK